MNNHKVKTNGHYVELDSLRGIASVLVLITHLMIVFPMIYSPSSPQDNLTLFVLKYLPFTRALFIGGPEAVKLFFVLSGFVLALPFLKGGTIRYLPYLLKRFLRICIPFYVAICLAVLLSIVIQRSSIPELSEWYNSMSWTTPISARLLLGHFFLIGNFNVNAFNNVIWSLVHEMRISILFPLMMYGVIRYSWQKNVAAYLLAGIIGFYLGGYGDTVGYMLLFVVGALLAKHRAFFIKQYKRTGSLPKIILFTFAYALYSLHAPGSNPLITGLVSYINMLGCGSLIIIALSSGRFSTILRNKAVSYLGRISYSLYLYHFIILVASIKLLYGVIPIGFILLLTAAASISIAALSYHFIEIPSIKWGKTLTRSRDTAIQQQYALPPSQ
ncbi:acyltransferase family protein [Paenibacillus sp. sgz500992]|uniref:acyltransferase family protein n=1 Tax=Paenibacillus sp. sgz500992 TaxID=3242476 RepID=UPI0036D216DA